MSDPAIERLNYFNGQRLETADLKLEQDYHINVRRWLNRSLLTPGIAAGLEVSVKPGDPHTVLVDPGLALDGSRREIILVDQAEFQVTGIPSNPGDPVFGNYLVIEYHEEQVATVRDGCAVQLGVTCRATEDLVWGAPSRILAQPKLSIQNDWPKLDETKPEDYKIVLAQLELNPDCTVRKIRSDVRQYVGPSTPDRVRGLSIEGEKDIDATNPKVLHFHVKGGHLDRAVLFLRGAQFSTLYYTELGQHDHALVGATKVNMANALQHKHGFDFTALSTNDPGPHRHFVKADVSGTSHRLRLEATPPNSNKALTRDEAGHEGEAGGQVHMEVGPKGGHTHSIVRVGAKEPVLDANPPDHAHDLQGKTGTAGISGGTLNVGGQLMFINDLQVGFDGTPPLGNDITAAVRAVISGTPAKIGDGTSGDSFVTAGVEIDLLQVAGVDLKEGSHFFTFSVNAGRGGKLHYNLYID